MNKPILYIFTISHYCEKARWALDYFGHDVDVQVVAPGTHLKIAQGLGLKRGSVPFLQTNNEVIQGSDAIISWAEKENQLGRSLGSLNKDVIAVEKRLDKTLGVHIRRWFYSEAIIEQPQLVKPIFLHQLSWLEALKFRLKWPVIRKLMIQRMDLGYQQGIESLTIVQQELEWLEPLMADGKPYLVGDSFSRADITAASLLAPLVAPNEYSCSALMQLPPRVQNQCLAMPDRPFWHWVTKQYQTHRC